MLSFVTSILGLKQNFYCCIWRKAFSLNKYHKYHLSNVEFLAALCIWSWHKVSHSPCKFCSHSKNKGRLCKLNFSRISNILPVIQTEVQTDSGTTSLTLYVPVSHVFTVLGEGILKIISSLQFNKRFTTGTAFFGVGETHSVHLPNNATVWGGGKKRSRFYFIWSRIHDARLQDPRQCKADVDLECADPYQRRNWPPPPGCRTREALWCEPRNPHRWVTSWLPPRAQHSSHTVVLKTHKQSKHTSGYVPYTEFTVTLVLGRSNTKMPFIYVTIPCFIEYFSLIWCHFSSFSVGNGNMNTPNSTRDRRQ